MESVNRTFIPTESCCFLAPTPCPCLSFLLAPRCLSQGGPHADLSSSFPLLGSYDSGRCKSIPQHRELQSLQAS